MEVSMLASRNKVVKALSLCGAVVFSSSAFAQAEGENASPEPTAQNQSTNVGEQPVEPAPQQLGHGTKAQAQHSAEATAHKSGKDPNNQRGTSLQGRTRPVLDAGAGTQTDTAGAPAPQDANPQAPAAQ